MSENGKLNPKVGIQTLLGGTATGKAKDIMKIFYDMGTGAARHGINWGMFDGPMDLKQLSGVHMEELEFANESGMYSLMELTAGNYKYTKNWWDVPITDEQLDAWYKFCYNLALQDTRKGDKAYEVWNEPNVSGFNQNNATAEQMVKLTQVSHDAIKAANPDAKIAGGVLSGAPGEYIEKLFDAGLGEYIDIFTIHPYTWSRSPEAGNMMGQGKLVREIMDKYGYSNIPLWFGEVGFYDKIDSKLQTAYTARMFLLNEIHKVAEKIIIFSAQKTPYVNTSEGFGLINSMIEENPMLAKPVFSAVANFTNVMNEAEYIETVSYDAELDIHRFKLSDGKDAIVFWTEDKVKNIALNLGTDNVTVMDVYGSEYDLYGIDGKFSFTASLSPTYVVGNFDKAEPTDVIFALDKYKLFFSNDGNLEFTVKNYTDRTYELALSKSENLITSYSSMLNGHVVCNLSSIGDNIGSGESVEVIIKDDDKTVYRAKLKAEILEGDGSAESPYCISSVEEFMVFSDIVTNLNSSACAILKNDIALPNLISDGAYIKTTEDVPYSGIFNGNEYTINLNIEGVGGNKGLFAYTKDATIKNLELTGIVSATGNTVGSVCAVANGGKFENVISSVNIKSNGESSPNYGGLIGNVISAITMEKCAYIGEFTVGKWAPNPGGLFGGEEILENKIRNCYVIADLTGGNDVCGLGKYGIFTNCYFAGNIYDAFSLCTTTRGTRENVYYCSDSVLVQQVGAYMFGDPVTSDQVESGYLAYLLGEDYGQLIGEDRHPVFATEDNRVYANETGYINKLYRFSYEHGIEIVHPEDVSAMLIIAVYGSDGAIVNDSSVVKNINLIENTLYEDEIPEISENQTVRVFLWDSSENIKPLGNFKQRDI